jgi:CDP-glucose 4,6-dehydratase
LAVAAWRHAFFTAPPIGRAVAIASARAGNVIGGGDRAEDRLIPDCIRAFAAGHPAPIRNPHAIRPWQHVLDPLCGYFLVAERLCQDGPAYAAGWNFDPAMADTQTVGQVADRLAANWGEAAGWVADATAHPPEARLLAINAAQARSRLGWRSRLRLPDAIDWTARWYQRQLRGAPVAALMEADIARYTVLGAA